MMKTAFKLSIMANVIMFAGFVFVLKHHPEPVPIPVPPTAQPELLPSQVRASMEVPPAKQESNPFQWSQIESTDYRQYIANLRGIGCPPQTIRDIITADVDTIYAPQRAQLQQKLKENPFSQPTIEAQLGQLQNQEASVLAALLGDPQPVAALASDTPGPTRNVRHKPPAEIALPLALQDVDFSALKLSNNQIQAIYGLRQRFTEEIGGTNQDPNDPGYRERWLKAQPEIDNEMRGMIGANAFQNYQLAVRAASGK